MDICFTGGEQNDGHTNVSIRGSWGLVNRQMFHRQDDKYHETRKGMVDWTVVPQNSGHKSDGTGVRMQKGGWPPRPNNSSNGGERGPGSAKL